MSCVLEKRGLLRPRVAQIHQEQMFRAVDDGAVFRLEKKKFN